MKQGSGGLRGADEEILYSTLGCRKGGVTPLALINDSEKKVKWIVDNKIKDNTLVLVHPIQNDYTFEVKFVDILNFLNNPTIEYIDFNNLENENDDNKDTDQQNKKNTKVKKDKKVDNEEVELLGITYKREEDFPEW